MDDPVDDDWTVSPVAAAAPKIDYFCHYCKELIKPDERWYYIEEHEGLGDSSHKECTVTDLVSRCEGFDYEKMEWEAEMWCLGGKCFAGDTWLENEPLGANFIGLWYILPDYEGYKAELEARRGKVERCSESGSITSAAADEEDSRSNSSNSS